MGRGVHTDHRLRARTVVSQALPPAHEERWLEGGELPAGGGDFCKGHESEGVRATVGRVSGQKENGRTAEGRSQGRGALVL